MATDIIIGCVRPRLQQEVDTARALRGRRLKASRCPALLLCRGPKADGGRGRAKRGPRGPKGTGPLAPTRRLAGWASSMEPLIHKTQSPCCSAPAATVPATLLLGTAVVLLLLVLHYLITLPVWGLKLIYLISFRSRTMFFSPENKGTSPEKQLFPSQITEASL